MNLLGVAGSPRNNSNSTYMVKTVLRATGQDYDLVLLKDLQIQGCRHCDDGCGIDKCIKDDMQEIYSKLEEADAIVLGSPTHYDNYSTEMSAFITRTLPFYFNRKLKGKRVGLVAVGNFEKGELARGAELDEDPVIVKQDSIESVVHCINAFKYAIRHLGVEIVGTVFAINSDPQSVEEKLVDLGRKLME